MKAFSKFFFSFLLLSLLHLPTSEAQCVIDSSQTQPGLHPDSLAVGTVNQFYSQDVTFVLITDTLGLAITNFLIQNINGLPIGMQWSCNHAANGCNYNPAQSLFGCVRIYGTPVVPGTYTLSISVIATVAFIGNQSFNFNSTLIISPALISNNGFTMTNAIGCPPLTVGFSSNLSAQDYIHWDFGNGDSSTLNSPLSVMYTNPGSYVITQTTIADTSKSYFLSSVKIDSIPNNAGFLDTPDMYILIKNQAGTTVFDSRPAVSNTNPPLTISTANLLLNNETYSINLWDEDTGITAPDDNLGTITFQGNGSSGIAFDTILGASGRLKLEFNITKVSPQPVVNVDTVHVFQNAQPPVVTASGPLTFCDGDTVLLHTTLLSGNQWYKNGNLLLGETNPDLWVTSAGNYFDVVTNNFGCSDTSQPFSVLVNFPPPFPNFSANGNVLTANVLGSYVYQWYLNDTAIAGATANTYTALITGNYKLQITDMNGCTRKSFPMHLLVTGISDLSESASFTIYPNPAKNEVIFSSSSPLAELKIVDLLGKEIYSAPLKQGKLRLDINEWNKGLYFVSVKTNSMQQMKKLLVE